MPGKKAAKPRISLAKDGPIRVQDPPKLTRAADGKTYEPRRALSLCRCGRSKSKPFCDGTHRKAGFKDEKLDGRQPDRRDDYEGRAITVHDNRGVCSHFGACTDGLPKVWRMKTEPWIDPDGEPPSKIKATIAKCPSGALSYSEKGVEHRDRSVPPQIVVMPGGPYSVVGGAELEGVEWGQGASREHFTLCRCGASKNKPFCDGSHWYFQWDDELQARAPAPAQDRWHDVGSAEELAKKPVQEVQAGGSKAALVCQGGRFTALSGVCPHAGGPLGQGRLKDGTLTCPWHGWSFEAASGKAVSGGAAAPTHAVEERGGRVFVNARPSGTQAPKKHPLQREVVREPGPLRFAGISATNMNPDSPRYSTSEALLEAALEHAGQALGAQTRLLKLRELGFRACEGYYSKSAQSCTWPCTITTLDPKDEMEKVYETLVFWADVVLVATPIRWGAASSLYFKMAERMNCIQNQITIADNVLIRNKVAAFIITGGQDNIQAVAGQMQTFFSELGFHLPQFPFIAHSRGWDAEDMEKNVEHVKKSEALRLGARELAQRAGTLAKTLLEAGSGAAKTCRFGRKANPARKAARQPTD